MAESTIVTFETTSFEQQMMGYAKELTKADVLQGYINILEAKEQERDRDSARNTLNMIRKLLDEPDKIDSPIVIEEDYCRTLLAVHKMLRANPIRLRYRYMDISGYFKLLQNVKKGLFNKNSGVNIERQVVAEEMSKLGLYPQVLTEKWEVRECKPPNRAFMDVLYKVNPNLAREDLARREYSKLDNVKDKNSKIKIEKTLDKLEE